MHRRGPTDAESTDGDGDDVELLRVRQPELLPGGGRGGKRAGRGRACLMASAMLMAAGVLARGLLREWSDAGELKLVTWNIAAINNNPFEYWITHEDAAYNKLMVDVQARRSLRLRLRLRLRLTPRPTPDGGRAGVHLEPGRSRRACVARLHTRHVG